MIKIEKDGKELMVPKSAYNNFYKNAGWTKVGGKKQEAMQFESVDDSEWDEALAEEEQEPTKPLSEMNRSELEQLARERGISLAGLSNTKQIREAVKAAL
nr:MAG TPA: HeH/LEM domain [Bacteriophage sp.]